MYTEEILVISRNTIVLIIVYSYIYESQSYLSYTQVQLFLLLLILQTSKRQERVVEILMGMVKEKIVETTYHTKILRMLRQDSSTNFLIQIYQLSQILRKFWRTWFQMDISCKVLNEFQTNVNNYCSINNCNINDWTLL